MLQHGTADGVAVVGDHLLENGRFSDEDDHFRRTRHGGVQQVPRQEHRCAGVQRQDHDGIFASLAFMNGYSVSKLKLASIFTRYNRFSAVKIYGNYVGFRVNLF